MRSILREFKDNSRGLTLIEILVVLTILGIVMAFLGGKLIGAGDKAKAKITKAKISSLGSYIEQFQLEYNTLPSSLDELVRCSDKMGGSCVPIAKEEELLDAWDTPFAYSAQGGTYTITSFGKDKKSGGSGVDGDITGKGP